jgi:hypothetical protein
MMDNSCKHKDDLFMKACCTSVATTVLLWPVVLIAQNDIETRGEEISQSLVKRHVAWQTKLSSTGASIEAKQVARRGSWVQYHLYVTGLPSDQLYAVVTWPVRQREPSTQIEGVSLGKDGLVMCAGRTPEQCGDPSTKDDPIDFTFNPAKGEPYRLAVVSGENRAAIVIVPDPITASDKNCTLGVVRLLPGFETAYFTGSGFVPDADITFEGESYDETHPIKTRTDHDGHLRFALMPFVAGHKKGTTTVHSVGTGCSLKISFQWGSAE